MPHGAAVKQGAALFGTTLCSCHAGGSTVWYHIVCLSCRGQHCLVPHCVAVMQEVALSVSTHISLWWQIKAAIKCPLDHSRTSFTGNHKLSYKCHVPYFTVTKALYTLKPITDHSTETQRTVSLLRQTTWLFPSDVWY